MRPKHTPSKAAITTRMASKTIFTRIKAPAYASRRRNDCTVKPTPSWNIVTPKVVKESPSRTLSLADKIGEIEPDLADEIDEIKSSLASNRKSSKIQESQPYRHRQRLSPQDSGLKLEDEGPNVWLTYTKADNLRHHSAELIEDPPEFWYKQTSIHRDKARLLWWGLTAKTRKSFLSASPVKLYTLQCAMQGTSPPFPATVKSLAGWIAKLSARRFKSERIEAFLRDVYAAHADLGFDDLSVSHRARLDRMINGHRRLREWTNT